MLSLPVVRASNENDLDDYNDYNAGTGGGTVQADPVVPSGGSGAGGVFEVRSGKPELESIHNMPVLIFEGMIIFHFYNVSHIRGT